MARRHDPGSQRTGRSLPLRVRITAVAVIVVGLALAAGSLILVHQLNAQLVDGVRSNAELRADSIASQLYNNPATRLDLSSADIEDDDEFIQIVDDQGRVLAATQNVAGKASIGTSDAFTLESGDAPFVVEDSDATTPQGNRTVVVGGSLDEARDAVGSVSSLLLLGFPAMVLIVGAVTWFVVGRTLAPVDKIRREADEIGAEQLHRRLPEPERHDEIGRLSETVNRMLDRLDHGQKQQRQFVADAAHELRSPIASIKQNIEVATTYPDHLSAEELAETVATEATRLERLVNALLSLARLDERSADLSTNAVDLDDLVFEEAGRLRQTTSLRIDISAVSAGRVAGDPPVLTQVLRNLTDNAQRHANETIALTLTEHEATVTLCVEDDGPGIPEPDRARVFERFVRLDEARTRDDGGSGLGLAIVDTIATAYGGSVLADASRLGGARILVTLPRLSDSA